MVGLFAWLQVIDFGSSCYENQRVYTYIQSRFYRAPEVILGARYGMPIDMWSLGCILAELFTGFPLLPGEDEADQLACIIEMLGMPPQKLLQTSKRVRQFISSKGYPKYCTATAMPDGTTVLSGGLSRRGKLRGPPGSHDLERALKNCDDVLFVDFLRRCLVWDPENRMTPNKALRHPWLRRRLPRPPGDKNDTLPAVTTAQPATTSGGSTLRTSASGSRSSSKTNSLQSGSNNIGGGRGDGGGGGGVGGGGGGGGGKSIQEMSVSAIAGYTSGFVAPPPMHGSNWANLSGHQSLNSVGGRSSSKTNRIQSGNSSDDVLATKSREQRDRMFADTIAGYSSTYVNPPGWASLSGHHSLNSVSGSRSSSKTNSLQSVHTAGDIISTSKTGQQRDRLDDLSLVNPYLGYACVSESHLHGNHRSNQSSSHQSLNSVDGATSGKQRASRQVHQAQQQQQQQQHQQQQQQQHNNNSSHSSSHDNYSSHGSSGSSSRLVLALHPAVQEILEELRR